MGVCSGEGVCPEGGKSLSKYMGRKGGEND